MEHRTKKLVDLLINGGWLKTPEIIKAFKKIKREDFLPENMKNSASLNKALPIGFEQTISQPLTVAFMLELLQPKPGDKILDIGSGSGWTSALLAEVVGKKGRVVAIERIKELKELGEKNIAKYDFIKNNTVSCVLGDGSKGFKKEAPYDKILVSAAIIAVGSTEAGPLRAWKEQLKIGGRLVCPIQNSIWLLISAKGGSAIGGRNNDFQEKEYPGFVFVPLVE